MRLAIILCFFLVSVLCFPLYDYSADSMQTMSGGSCSTNAVSFSQPAPILNVLTTNLWGMGFGVVRPNDVCTNAFPFIMPYTLNTGYSSGKFYFLDIIINELTLLKLIFILQIE